MHEPAEWCAGISYRNLLQDGRDLCTEGPPRTDKEGSHRGYCGVEAPRHLPDSEGSTLMEDERDALPLGQRGHGCQHRVPECSPLGESLRVCVSGRQQQELGVAGMFLEQTVESQVSLPMAPPPSDEGLQLIQHIADASAGSCPDQSHPHHVGRNNSRARSRRAVGRSGARWDSSMGVGHQQHHPASDDGARRRGAPRCLDQPQPATCVRDGPGVVEVDARSLSPPSDASLGVASLRRPRVRV
jgi:hypothetical protein